MKREGRSAKLIPVIGASKAVPYGFYNVGDLIYTAVQSPFIYAATVQGDACIGLSAFEGVLVMDCQKAVCKRPKTFRCYCNNKPLAKPILYETFKSCVCGF